MSKPYTKMNTLERVDSVERLRSFAVDVFDNISQKFGYTISPKAARECQKSTDKAAKEFTKSDLELKLGKELRKSEVSTESEINRLDCHLDANALRNSNALTKVIDEQISDTIRSCSKNHEKLYKDLSTSESFEFTSKWLGNYTQLLEGCVASQLSLSKAILEKRGTRVKDEDEDEEI